MQKVHDERKAQNTREDNGGPVHGNRSDLLVEREAAHDKGKGDVGECEDVDRHGEAAHAPASRRQGLAQQPLAEDTADRDEVGGEECNDEQAGDGEERCGRAEVEQGDDDG